MDADDLHVAERIVAGFLADTDLPPGEGIDCPYRSGRTARAQAFLVEEFMDGAIHRAFMDRGFRRSGRVFYHPVCTECQQCIPFRVPVEIFRPSRSMRRVWKRNGDVRVAFGDCTASEAKRDLFARYLDAQHDGTMSGEPEEFNQFLYDSPVPTMEICYYLGNRLVGVSLADVCPGALSSVYMFFDPDEAHRSLGTYSILWEINHCRSKGMAYYYLGYWVPGSKTMDYKARFQPGEILDATGQWIPWNQAGIAGPKILSRS